MNDRDTNVERTFTELFQRMPTEHAPLGFRDTVMARIAAESARRWRWEWLAAFAVAIPSLIFLMSTLIEHGDELGDGLGSIANALLGLEDWDASTSVYVDGIVLLAVALVGIAGLLVTHALLAEEQTRSRVHVA